MGVCMATIRLLTLVGYKNDLEKRIQSTTETLLGVQSQSDELVSFGANLDPDSIALQELNAKKDELNSLEKKLEQQQKQQQAQLEAVNQEIQSCQQLLSSDIQSGIFSYSLGGR